MVVNRLTKDIHIKYRLQTNMQCTTQQAKMLPCFILTKQLLFNTMSAVIQLYDGEEQITFQRDDDHDDVCFVLDKHAEVRYS